MGELIFYVIGGLAAVIGAVALDLIRDQAKASTPRIAEWLRRRAVKRLPESLRERLDEEWAALLNETAGPLAKLGRAIGFLFSTHVIVDAEVNENLALMLEVQEVMRVFYRARNLLEDSMRSRHDLSQENKIVIVSALGIFDKLIEQYHNGDILDEHLMKLLDELRAYKNSKMKH
jgi:hypothetical protein